MEISIWNSLGPAFGTITTAATTIGLMLAMIALPFGMIASPFMGVVRGVRNGDTGNAILSMLIPIYGLIYFFVGKQTSPPRLR